jgi:hypothetical protein
MMPAAEGFSGGPWVNWPSASRKSAVTIESANNAANTSVFICVLPASLIVTLTIFFDFAIACQLPKHGEKFSILDFAGTFCA